MDQVYELTFSPVAALSLAVLIAIAFSTLIAFFFLGADLLHVVADGASRVRAIATHVIHQVANRIRNVRDASATKPARL